jgi:hypothetical protein
MEKTWSLTVRNEVTLRAFGNRVPSRIYALKKDKIT